MRTLVVLAVMGVCSATYQASSYGYGYGHPGAYGYVQPKWKGPVAATVPAGVGGKIIPVSDTYEVAAARNAFFRAYDDQLAKINALRYGTSRYGGSYGHGGSVYAAPVYTSAHVYSAPAPSYGAHSHSYGAAVYAPGPVRDTPEVAAAKAQFFHLYEKQAAAAAAAPDDYTYHSKPVYHHHKY